MLPSLSSIVSRLRLKQLRLIVALADHGSLVRAAEQVHLSQPGATKALKEIESAIGATLFIRSNRGLEPNALGHCVVRYARLILTDLSHLREELLGILHGRGGRLAVGTIMGGVPFLTDALSRLLVRQPSVNVQIVEDTSTQLLELLDQGRLDVALCRTSVSEHPDLYQTLKVRDEELAVVAHPRHPLAKRRTLQLKDLGAFRWVVYRANMPMRLLLEREFHDVDVPFPATLIETTSAFTTLSFLQRHPSMVAMLSVDVAKEFERFGFVKLLPVAFKYRSEPYLLVTRRDRHPTPVSEMFIAEFAAKADAPPANGPG
jgi:DNA-binding transcriptional LysR family regulator